MVNKIKWVPENNVVELKSLAVGDCFKLNGRLYMLMDITPDRNVNRLACISLETGVTSWINWTINVVPVSIEINATYR